jgi:2-polyprenyl-6-methoxyphenol hydroxylase-like FAD-dependent oxidoreductase
MKRGHESEVLIVGAGPVGMLTALLLRQKGVDVRIIDQHSRTAAKSYACGLHPHSLELLDRSGLAYDVIKQGRRIDSIGFYRGNDRVSQLNLAELPSKFPFVIVLEQSALEDILEQALRRFGNIKVNWNQRFINLDASDEGAVVSIEKLAHNGRGYSVPEFEWGVEKELTEETRFVVGSDGQNSGVRRCLNIPYHCNGAPEVFTVFQTKIEGDSGHEMKVVIENGLASVMWPVADNDCRWSFQLADAEPPSDFPAKERERVIVVETPALDDSLSRVRCLLDKRAPWFKEKIIDVDWTTRIQFEHRVASQFGQGRSWLAGDAAHQTGPIGMQSMNIGLCEAADLAEKLRKILREGGSPELLNAYDGEHRAEWNRMLGLAGALQSNGHAPPWVTAQCSTILRALPASGKELAVLLANLGLRFK